MIDFQKEYVLENELAKLVPLKREDINDLMSFSMDEPELWTYSLQTAAGKENMEAYIQTALDSRHLQKSYPFLIWDKRTNTVAGSTRFYDYQQKHQTIQLGYTWYGAKFQRTGLNRFCKYLMLDFAFDTIKVERVEFRADANNERSITAMKSLGCKEEGILRSNCSSPTGRRDSIILSILKEEWYHEIKESLANKCYPK